MVHVRLVPPQAPSQPRKTPPVAGVAVSVTVSFCTKFVAQEVPPLPQLILPVPPVTMPLPVTATLSSGPVGFVNVAVTLFPVVPSIVNVQVSDVLVAQAPAQLAKLLPGLGGGFRGRRGGTLHARHHPAVARDRDRLAGLLNAADDLEAALLEVGD